MIFITQSINIKDIPKEFVEELELPNNGGNVIYVEEDSLFGTFLISNGFSFGGKGWRWLVVFDDLPTS